MSHLCESECINYRICKILINLGNTVFTFTSAQQILLFPNTDGWVHMAV